MLNKSDSRLNKNDSVKRKIGLGKLNKNHCQEDKAHQEQVRQTQKMFAALMHAIGAAAESPPSPLQ